MEYDVSLQTVAWINGRRNDDTLEISPKFQRRAVWLEKERQALIATVCENLPFPEIYIQVETDLETGRQAHVVVDGQQRITSLLMFIDGEVSLPDDETWSGQSLRDLEPVQQVKFWDYKIVVRMLRHASDAEIRELFGRLNTNNIALNDQELRNAKYQGRFKSAAERLADDPFFQSIGLFSARDIRRMLDIEFVGELLLLVVEGITNKKDLLDDAYARFNEDFPRESEFENEFNAAVSLLRSLVRDENQTTIKTKSNFYSLFGACVRYYRDTQRPSFKNADAIAEKLTDLFEQARRGPRPDAPEYVQHYYDAVSRAASDRARRQTREDVLYQLIREIESSTPAAA